MIAVGELAPPFLGTASDGSRVDSSAYHGRPLLLYFYPKANTAGCSMEARGFAEHYQDLQKAGIALVGVSVDSVDAQKRFSDRCEVPFPLIADRDKSISRLYGVLGFLGVARRVTFFIGSDGRVREVVEGILPGPHVRRAVELARAPSAGTAPP
ncbi:MAG: peroxiredoxin [Thermoplasmata archaeon]